MAEVVHIIGNGESLCGFPANGLPYGHTWSVDRQLSTCAKCRAKAGLATNPQHWLSRIDEIYVVVADNPEGEGVAAALLDNQWMPLIAADASRLKNIMAMARDVAANTGLKMRLVKFSTREVIEEIEVTARTDAR